MKNPLPIVGLILVAVWSRAGAAELFDGKSLAGWEGDLKWWRVQDGALTGGSLTEKVPRNLFLATTGSFQNFDLRLQLKLTGVPNTGMINSGVQIRSLRVPNNTEMSGYQVDAGDGWWGKLYDESRRNKVIAESADLAAVNAAVKPGDWNEYRIRTEGPRIRSWINGVPALDYTETEPAIAQDGHIAIQIHGGGMALAQVKEVRIEVLPPTPGPTWDQVGHPKPREPGQTKKKDAVPPPKKSAAAKQNTKSGAAAQTARDISYNAVTDGPRSPEEERRAFVLPPGFEMELVVAESEGLGKFVALTWDAQMRLWTTTALEYPVDGNENKSASDALFARGGRDRVVVFDNVYGAAVGAAAQPRIFADGLVMPLGVLPYQDGAFVQYGGDIRLYRDPGGHSRADRHEVVLTGFGTQDSHLFPHQFLRQPGGWLFVAQGLFNYSAVRRPGGQPFADGAKEIPFNQCKLARFTPDGSSFESVTAGPNNIWGLTTGREGETFLQEANDQGYPVIPYAPGILVRTGSKDRLRPYQPLMPPPLNPPQMGGTGLSGLALAEDGDGIFRNVGQPRGADDKVFFLANPITGTVNTVRAVSEGPRYRYEKLADFVTSGDRWFRPVAIEFGPDGCLYIVDWYNKIISHNEVPREHPDRDKIRGRIWRVRHRDQPRAAPPNLAQLDDRALLAQLGGPNSRVARLAWLELGDRRAAAVAPELAQIAADRGATAARRLGALWALENLQPVDTALLRLLAAEPNPHLRREAGRIAAASARPEDDFLAVAAPLVGDPDPRVRAAVGDALRHVRGAGPRVMLLAAQLGRESLATGGEWERYEREFERYLARWAMETYPEATHALLNSPAGLALPLEQRMLATLALGGKRAAGGVALLVPELRRPLASEEVRVLTGHFDDPAVNGALTRALAAPESRAAVLRALLELRTGFDPAPLNASLTAAAKTLLATGATAADQTLGAEVAGAFKLSGVEPGLVTLLQAHWRAPKQPLALAALRALRENGGGPPDLLEEIARRAGEPALRDEALAALAASRSGEAAGRLVKFLPELSTTQRGNAIQRLAGTKTGAAALMTGLRSGEVATADPGVSTVDKLRALLPGDPQIAALWNKLGGDTARTLRLGGANDDYAAAQLTLEGPFTVECWAKLEAPISNFDGILGAAKQLDLNFHAGQFRAWVNGAKDIVVARKKTTPGVWTHYAVTRDTAGVFQIYLNGELDATSTATHTGTYTGLDVGRTMPTAGGTAGWLAEFRVWSEARSAREIRENFDRSYASEAAGVRPARLQHIFSGANWGTLHGGARVEATEDAPALLTPAEAAAQAEKFARFRKLAAARGNPEQGRELFTAICLACHQQAGKGGQIAPALDGVGHTGIEALLRNLLTPSAAMESAYQTFRVVMNDGGVTDGFLVEQNAEAILLRLPGAEDRRIARKEIRSAAYLRRSLMPEGLLEALTPEQVTDLFAHLKSLK